MRTLLLAAAASALAISAATSSHSQAPINPPRAASAGVSSFADVVERVSPAVVSIETRRRVQARTPRLPTIPGLPFEMFPEFRDRPPVQEGRAAGSGFFISADGYIVTNNHVIEDATEITVNLKDQRELKATVVGRDEPTDLAVLKVEGRGFPFVSFANSARPRVGDWVVAVGNPFGLGGTATAGIVSAYGRDIGSTFVDYIQLDAPINRGNSGGPSFDAQGRVIGVNTMIYSPSGGNVGIGFAIPADVADQIVRDLIGRGRIDRGYIGATVQTLSSDMAESLGQRDRKGVLVTEVNPGSPSDQAGLRTGDIVLRLNGQPVENASQLTRRVAGSRPGDVVRFEILRDGAPRTLEVRTALRPGERQLAGLGPSGTARPGALGLVVGPLDEAARRRFGIVGEARGVVVEEVEPDADVARQGVRAGDVIVRAHNRPIATPADLAAAVEAARAEGRQSVLLFVRRGGTQRAVAARFGAPAG